MAAGARGESACHEIKTYFRDVWIGGPAPFHSTSVRQSARTYAAHYCREPVGGHRPATNERETARFRAGSDVRNLCPRIWLLVLGRSLGSWCRIAAPWNILQ